MAAPVTKHQPGSSNSDGIERIKEILVGDYNRDWDQRLAQLGSQLNTQMESLRRELRQRVDDLDHYLRKEINSLTERAKREEVERIEGIKRVETQMGDESRELRAHAFAASNRFHTEIDERCAQIDESIKSSLESLSAQKTDRQLLGTLFQEIGKRLSLVPTNVTEPVKKTG